MKKSSKQKLVPALPIAGKDIQTTDGKLDNADSYFTVTELARRWSCGEETIRRKIRARVLPCIKPAGKHLIAKRDVIKYEEKA